MILYPSVDALLKRIDSRYSLVMLSSKRAHELDDGAPELLDHYKSSKSLGKALEEIEAGKVSMDSSDEAEKIND